MKLQNELYTVKCIHHHFKYSNKFERVPSFFNAVRYLTLGTFNVLIIHCLTCLLRCDQFVLVRQQWLQIIKLK